MINRKDYVIRGISKNKKVRVFIADTTNLVEKARLTHESSATISAALGRLLTAGVLMSVDLKSDKNSITLRVKGDGPAGNIVVVADGKGRVKGYVDNPKIDIPSRKDGKLDVGGIVGEQGYLSVVKDLGLKEPYTGQVPLVSGEIAEDLVNYYYISEQINSAINLGVLVDKNLNVIASGGYMIQLMPGFDEDDIEKIENIISNIEPISTLINEGYTPEKIALDLFKELEIEILDKIEIEFICDCSKERMEKALLSLGREELENIKNEGEAEVVCHFCNEKHIFSVNDIENMLR